ncbi:MAG: hypothetical protein ACQPRH_04200 [Solitalea-like symbiont of Tyrophagus putrescentiae]
MKSFAKHLLLASLLLLFGYNASAQNQDTKSTEVIYKPGTPRYLLVKKGFKIFKLGDPITKYQNDIILVNEDKHAGHSTYKLLSFTDPDLVTVGDSIKINDIHLDVHNGLVASISVFVREKYKREFLKVLQAAYGKGRQPDPNTEKYIWAAANKKTKIVLSYSNNYQVIGRLHGNSWALFQDINLINQHEQDRKNEAIKDL